MAVFATSIGVGHPIQLGSADQAHQHAHQAAIAAARQDLARVANRLNIALSWPEYSDGGVWQDRNRTEQLIQEVSPTFDPWGQAYRIQPSPANSSVVTRLRVESAGPDETVGTADDIAGHLRVLENQVQP